MMVLSNDLICILCTIKQSDFNLTNQKQIYVEMQVIVKKNKKKHKYWQIRCKQGLRQALLNKWKENMWLFCNLRNLYFFAYFLKHKTALVPLFLHNSKVLWHPRGSVQHEY